MAGRSEHVGPAGDAAWIGAQGAASRSARSTAPSSRRSQPAMTHRQFRNLFSEFTAPSWRAWNSVEDCLFGLDPEDPALMRRITGRTTLPTAPASELWAIVGRGGG